MFYFRIVGLSFWRILSLIAGPVEDEDEDQCFVGSDLVEGEDLSLVEEDCIATVS